MELINFQDGVLVKGAYVTIDEEEYPVTKAEYSGTTPLSAYVLNKMQQNIKEAIEATQTQIGNISTLLDTINGEVI